MQPAFTKKPVLQRYRGKTARTVRYWLFVFFTPVIALLLTQILAPQQNNPFAPQKAIAATSATLNFQARLLQSSGAVVPDGNYHIEFKLYRSASASASAQGVCTGTSDDCLWLETRTTGNLVRVSNGYVTVNLGSITSFPASINWDQDLWLTMRVGGSAGSAAWDTEMTNAGTRTKLTAVPFAFRAAMALSVSSSLTNTASTNSSNVAITTGNATGITSNSGNITIDSGTATQTAGTISLGASNASALTIGRTGVTTTLQGSITLSGTGTALNVTNNASIGGALAVTSTSTFTGLLTANGGITVSGATASINTVGTADTAIGNATGTLTITGNNSSTFVINGTTVTAAQFVLLNGKDAPLVDTNDAVSTAITGTGALTSGSIGGSFGNINIGTNIFTGDGSGLSNLNGTNISTGTVANARLTNSGALTITAGTGLSGGGSVSLGGTATLNVAYGSAAGTAAQGNVTIICPTGSGNLTGGGNTITLGTGGTCGALSTNNAVSFTTSVTSPSFTGTGAVTLSSGGAAGLTLDSASNTLSIAANDTTLQRIASGVYTFDLSDAATTTLTLTNSGAGVADLNIAEGSLFTAGTSRLTNGGALQNITGLTIVSGGASITGGINNNSGNITSAGSITGVGANITATAALTVASGGTGDLTLTSASGLILLGSPTLQRTAAGTTSLNLVDVSNTTFALTNSGTGLANLTTDGSITAGNGLTVSANGASITGNSQVLGNTLLKSTVNSASAVLIQNSTGDNVVKIDTTSSNLNNVVSNASFEAGVTGWSAKGTTPTVFAQDLTQYYDGAASLKVTTQATTDQGAKYAVTGGLTVNAGYSLSFYIKLDPLSNAMTTLGVGYSSDGATDNTPCNVNTTTITPTGWTRVSCSFTTPATFSGTPYIYIKQTDAVVHTFYVDGVLLQTDANTDANYRNAKISLQGTVVTPLILQNTANSTNALAVQNANGTNVFSIDTTDTNSMITNPGFEVGVTGWSAFGGTTTIERATNQSWLGNASLKINASNTAGTGAKYITGNVQPTQLAISSTYTISWYAKLSSGTFTDIIAQYDRDGSGAGVPVNCTGIANPATVSTAGWTRFSCVITTDAVAPSADAYISIVQTSAPGAARVFYVDAVQLEGGSVVTDYGAGSIFFNGTIVSPTNFKNKDNSTTAFTIQNSAATPLFQVDTLNNRLYVGSVTTDATAVLLVLDSYNQSTDPTGTNGAEYYSSYTDTIRCSQGVVGWTDCIGAPKPNTRRTSQIDYIGSGTALTARADIATVVSTTLTATAASVTESPRVDYGNSGALNNVASISGNLNYNTSAVPLFQTSIQVPVLGNKRVWVGLTNQTAAIMGASANPAGTYAAFRYDTSAADANWKCITKDGTNQNIIDSGVVVATTGVKMEIIIGSASTVFKINGRTVCTSIANLPSASTMVRYSVSVTGLTAIVNSIRLGWVYLEANQ